MPIIRVSKAQIAKATKARNDGLLKNPEYRLYEERQLLRRQAASKQKGRSENAQKARQAAPNDPAYRPCDESQRLERDTVVQEPERRS